jgi:hypothetical protein
MTHFADERRRAHLIGSATIAPCAGCRRQNMMERLGRVTQLRLGSKDRLPVRLRHEADVRHVRGLAKAPPVPILALI